MLRELRVSRAGGAPRHELPTSVARGTPLFPAIAIPVEKGKAFERPEALIKQFTARLPQVTTLLVIGWRGAEAHFLIRSWHRISFTQRFASATILRVLFNRKRLARQDEFQGAAMRLRTGGKPFPVRSFLFCPVDVEMWTHIGLPSVAIRLADQRGSRRRLMSQGSVGWGEVPAGS
jgi:hypothetical protein